MRASAKGRTSRTELRLQPPLIAKIPVNQKERRSKGHVRVPSGEQGSVQQAGIVPSLHQHVGPQRTEKVIPDIDPLLHTAAPGRLQAHEGNEAMLLQPRTAQAVTRACERRDLPPAGLHSPPRSQRGRLCCNAAAGHELLAPDPRCCHLLPSRIGHTAV